MCGGEGEEDENKKKGVKFSIPHLDLNMSMYMCVVWRGLRGWGSQGSFFIYAKRNTNISQKPVSPSEKISLGVSSQNYFKHLASSCQKGKNRNLAPPALR